MYKFFLIPIAAGALSASANASLIADLYADYTGTDLSGATVGTTTFSTNNWSFFEGFAATTELTYSTTLGTDNGTGFGGTGFEEVALVSADGVFDGNTPSAGELTFHPRDGSGPPSDLHIRWTADQNYLGGIEVDFNFRTPTGSNVGFAQAYNGGTVQNIALNWGAAGTSGTVDEALYPSFDSVSAGDTIDFIIFNVGSFAGDQTFGNLTITAVPEPGDASILALGITGILLNRRRRRRS